MYFAIAAVYTWPLLRDVNTRVGVHFLDPVLNASILWWNALIVPFSPAWWSGLHYYPSPDVSAFTENLVGISVFASPVYWLTHNPITAYNVALFLTWPLSAFTTYLLVYFVMRRHDAAFLAGLAYGFSPFRTTEFGHIQMISSYWLPLCLLGLHGFLAQRRARWLWLFGVAWILQSLANGYSLFFGGTLIALWLLYFCSTRRAWRAAVSILVAWALSSVPLVPILIKYRNVHEYFAMHRALSEILAMSARPHSWVEVSPDVWFWHRLLPEGRDDLFPGLTALAVVVAAIGVAVLKGMSTQEAETAAHRRMRVALGVITAISAAAIAISLIVGPWRVLVAGMLVRMGSIDRALVIMLACGTALALITRRTRDALARRSPFVFYTIATILIALLACGPILRVGAEYDQGVLLSSAPYRWLLAIPGFSELRVPTRFWMLGTLTLAIAAALGYRMIRPARARARTVAFTILAAALLVDGWMPTMRMADAPQQWAQVEVPGRPEPILELPIGEEGDYAATFRAGWHGRRVVNGVSGYNPPHYIALMAGLQNRDPATLTALASLGAIDVVVSHDQDRDGAIDRYVSAMPGATRVADDGSRTAYRLPRAPQGEPTLGPVLPIAHVEAFKYDASTVIDGRIETGWGEFPQYPGQWVIADLGVVQDVAGVTHAIGEYLLDFPRRLAIEVSVDGSTWERVWDGPTYGPMFLSSIREPRVTAMRFAFPRHRARFVRLQQLEQFQSMWRLSELKIHGPT